jgi:catechol 2,3-dioxygenase-like lactoylglutathione lyase family enzyme
MAIRGIDHVNIGTARLEDTKRFFLDVLGLSEGWRPPFAFNGAWLYAGETAVVHLVELDQPKGPSAAAALDHFAFRIDDLDGVVRRLDEAGIAYRLTDVPGSSARQVFVRDLNGVNIELNWRP